MFESNGAFAARIGTQDPGITLPPGTITLPPGGTPPVVSLPLAVTLLSPNGGTLTPGQQVTIQWQSSGAASQSVKYTLDGANYIDIVNELPGNVGSTAWLVPQASTATARVRVAIRDAAGNRLTDDSDAPFTIQPVDTKPAITALAPNSGPASGGTTVTITGRNFQSGCGVRFDGVDAQVLSVTSTQVVVRTPAAGPGVTLVSVRLVNPDGQFVVAASAYTYIAVPLTVKILSPNGGTLTPGQAVTIQWQSSGATSQSVKYTLDGANYIDIVNDLSGDARSTTWVVPQANTATARVRVAIRDVAGNRVTDDSDSPITITTIVAGGGDTDTLDVRDQEKVIAAGQAVSFNRSITHTPPGTSRCAGRTLFLQSGPGVDLQTEIIAGVPCSTYANGVLVCDGTGQDPACGRYAVLFATNLGTSPGKYVFGLLDENGVEVTYTSDKSTVRLRFMVREPKVKIRVLSGPSTLMAGESGTFKLEVTRDGYLGPIQLMASSSPALLEPAFELSPVMIPSRLSDQNLDAAADAVETADLIVRSYKPMGGATPGTMQGSYTIFVDAVAPPGVPLKSVRATLPLSVDVRPDADITIEPVKINGRDLKPEEITDPLPADAGATVEYLIKLFRYDLTDPVPVMVTAMPPGAKIVGPTMIDTTPLQNGNGTRTRYSLMVTIDPATEPKRFPVTVQALFMRNMKEIRPEATSNIKVRSKSDGDGTIILSAIPPVPARAGSCVTCTVMADLVNFTKPDMIALSLVGMPSGITATFASKVLDPAKGEEQTTLNIAVGEDVAPGSYAITIQGKGATNMSTVSEPIDILVSVSGRPLVKLVSAASTTPVKVPQGGSGMFSFDVVRKAAGCSAEYTRPVMLGDPIGLPGKVTFSFTNRMPATGTMGSLMLTVPLTVTPGMYMFMVPATTSDADIENNPITLMLEVVAAPGGSAVVVTGPPDRMEPYVGGEVVNVAWTVSGMGEVAAQKVEIFPKDGNSFISLEFSPAPAARMLQPPLELPNPTVGSGTVIDAVVRVTTRFRSGESVVGMKTFRLAYTAGPEITRVDPPSGRPGTKITIFGTGFIPGRSMVTFTGPRNERIPAMSAAAPSMIQTTVPQGAVSGELRVTNPFVRGALFEAGSAFFPTNSVTVTPPPDPGAAPQIALLTPAQGPAGTRVQITGANLLGATAVAFNGIVAQFQAVSAGVISALVPQGARTGAVTVTTPAGTARSAVFFQVTVLPGGPIIKGPVGGPAGGRLPAVPGDGGELGSGF